MQIIDNLLIMFIHVACFVTGIKLANWYNNRAHQQEKDALERQFLRLRANSDADDPCKPYMPRYDCAWTAAGETGSRIGRATILDDGNYHYTMTVMADSADAGTLQETWQELFATFQVVSTDS